MNNKHNIFLKRVYELVGDEYEVIGEYKNTRNKVIMKHKCGHEWKSYPNNFLQGHRCPKCMRKIQEEKLIKSQEKFKQELYELLGDEYILIGKYMGNDNKILIKHNIQTCGYEYEVFPYSILHRGYKCPKCTDRIPYDTNLFKEKIHKLVGNNFTVISEYIRKDVEILMKHNICDKSFNIKPHNFLITPKCPYCKKRVYKKWTNKEVELLRQLYKIKSKNELEEIFKTKYANILNIIYRYDIQG